MSYITILNYYKPLYLSTLKERILSEYIIKTESALEELR